MFFIFYLRINSHLADLFLKLCDFRSPSDLKFVAKVYFKTQEGALRMFLHKLENKDNKGANNINWEKAGTYLTPLLLPVIYGEVCFLNKPKTA